MMSSTKNEDVDPVTAVEGDDEYAEFCPICLGNPKSDNEDRDNDEKQQNSLVYGKCGHKFCLPCLQQLFAAPASPWNVINNNRSSDGFRVPVQEDILNVPTLGRCPICRGTLCLIDLKHCRTLDGSEEEMNAVETEQDMRKTDLADLVFVKRGRKEGDESIHFPISIGTDNASPFLSFEKWDGSWQFDDGTLVTTKQKQFDLSSCRFHKESRTFHGTIRWDIQDHTSSVDSNQQTAIEDCGKRLNQSNAWEYVLSFSSDFRYVVRGVLIQRRDPCRRSNCPIFECKFLLDGEWAVEWSDDRTVRHPLKGTILMIVHGNYLFSANEPTKPLGKIEFDNVSKILTLSRIRETGELQQLQSAAMDPAWCHHIPPQGPPIDASIVWPEVSSDVGSMIWTRKTETPADTPLNVVQLSSDHGIFYHMLGVIFDGPVTKPRYLHDRLWGNVFCQVMTVGLASYHFNEDGSAYISYEHERTSLWPNLDNGEPVPPRMPFVDTLFDEQSRTFRGIIDWEGTQGTTWTSARWWRYRIVFADDFSCIIGGNVKVKRRNDDDEPILSSFGEDLLYINVGFAEQAREELQSHRNPVSAFLSEANRLHALRRQIESLGGDSRPQSPLDNLSRLHSLFYLSQTADVQYPATSLSSQQEYGL